MVQVHQQESEIVKHVDAGDILGKLDAVEQQRPSVHEADVAQVQIAMAETHLSGIPPVIEQCADTRHRTLQGAFEAVDPHRLEPGGPRPAQDPDIGLDQPGHRGGPAPVGTFLGPVVEFGDMRAQRIKQLRRQRSAPGHAIEQVLRREPPHHDDVIGDLVIRPPGPPPPQTPVFAAADRPHFEIERRRGAAVEPEFGAAGGKPKRERREVEIGVFDRALQLVGVGPGKEHQRAVRFDDLHRRGAGRIRRGIAQKRHNLVLFVAHPASPPRQPVTTAEAATPPCMSQSSPDCGCREVNRRTGQPSNAICTTASPRLRRRSRMPPR